jgi:DNA-binding NarL/FixJ family response regulator
MMDSAIMRVFLADDQAGLHSALRLLLEQEPGMELVGEATSADGLLSSVLAAHPNLLLLDWELPDLKAADRGRRLLAVLHTNLPYLHVVVLSGRPESNRSALAAGADSFVSKADPPEKLLTALRNARDSLKHGDGGPPASHDRTPHPPAA